MSDPPLTTKKVFPYVQVGFPFLQLTTAASCPSSLLRLNKPSSLRFSSHITLQSSKHLSDPLLHLLQNILIFLALGTPNWTQYPRCSLATADNRGRIASLDLLVRHLPIQPSLELAFIPTGVHRLAHVQPDAHCGPWVLFCRAAAQAVGPRCCRVLSQARCGSLHLSLLNFTRSLFAPFLQLSRCL